MRRATRSAFKSFYLCCSARPVSYTHLAGHAPPLCAGHRGRSRPQRDPAVGCAGVGVERQVHHRHPVALQKPPRRHDAGGLGQCKVPDVYKRQVQGLGHFLPLTAPVDCCESGSTLRFLIPIASLTGQPVTFTGRGRLMERPQSVYETLYREQNLRFEQSPAGLTLSLIHIFVWKVPLC